MVKTKVEAGVCGFVTDIKAYSEDSQFVSFNINSNCEKINKLSQKITTVDAYNEIKDGFDGELYSVIRQELKGCCSGCAVPVGIFKSMQVTAMLALPMDINIKIVKVDDPA
ncbi:MAG: hypothetical protein QG641_1861 [Candidatus Poribacteria bacterium]|nr:hypothetical protein [Candidatus Poribacteria bacterium]